jgi:filamentous hemagglutinin
MASDESCTMPSGIRSPAEVTCASCVGSGRTGGRAPDLKVSRVVDGKVETVRIQTISTKAGGIPDAREAANAARIRAAFPNNKLIFVPKGGTRKRPESVSLRLVRTQRKCMQHSYALLCL